MYILVEGLGTRLLLLWDIMPKCVWGDLQVDRLENREWLAGNIHVQNNTHVVV